MEKLMKFLITSKISFKLIAKDELYELHVLSYTSDKELIEIVALLQQAYQREGKIIMLLPTW